MWGVGVGNTCCGATMKRVFLSASMLFTFLFLPACAGEFTAFEKAKSSNTSAGYQEFLTQYPDGVNAEVARGLLDSLDWDLAAEADTSAAYDQYVAIHPEGEHVEEARGQAATLAWREAEEANTREAIEAFLARGDEGALRKTAEGRLALMDLLPTQLEIGETAVAEDGDAWTVSCPVRNIGDKAVEVARFRITWIGAGGEKRTKRLWFVAREPKNANGAKDRVDPKDLIAPLRPGKSRDFTFTFGKTEVVEGWTADIEHTVLDLVELELGE